MCTARLKQRDHFQGVPDIASVDLWLAASSPAGLCPSCTRSMTNRPRPAPRRGLESLAGLWLPQPGENRARFERRRAEAVSHYNHPNILPIIEFDTSGVDPYILMPFVDGHDLRLVRRRLWQANFPTSQQQPAARRSPTRSPARTIERIAPRRWARRTRTYARVALVGLQAARASSHTPISGITFIATSSRQTCCSITRGRSSWPISGLARRAEMAFGDLTATGDIPGTMRYLAPENLHRACGPRSDIFSLGLTLYELLTLRPAFDAPNDKPVRDRTLRLRIERDVETELLGPLNVAFVPGRLKKPPPAPSPPTPPAYAIEPKPPIPPPPPAARRCRRPQLDRARRRAITAKSTTSEVVREIHGNRRIEGRGASLEHSATQAGTSLPTGGGLATSARNSRRHRRRPGEGRSLRCCRSRCRRRRRCRRDRRMPRSR